MAWRLILGFLLAALVAWVAWRVRALDSSGGLAAWVSGGLIFGLGGPALAALLLTFFISSSALSRAFRRRKAALGEKFAKGSRRDWGQVLANGGLAALLAVVWAALDGPVWPALAFMGAMAAVNADTWATELGVLSPTPPRRLTDGRLVERGASGGVTWLGLLASLGGAGLVGLVGGLLLPGVALLPALGLAMLAGLAGSLLDSLLGATVQGVYHCPTCQKETERHPVHVCGTTTRPLRGWRWLNNDLVNFLASVAGATLAALGWLLVT